MALVAFLHVYPWPAQTNYLSANGIIILCDSYFQIGFAATDNVTTLKLIEAGIPKERLALLAVPMVPLQIILPWIISKYTAGPKPLSVFLKAMPFR